MANCKNNFWLTDILKFFFCLCVIGIHTQIFSKNAAIHWWLEKAIFRLAVPFFLLTSGFLFGEKIYNKDAIEQRGALYNFETRLMKLLLFFEPISLGLNVIKWYIEGDRITNILLRSGQSILFYPLGALWFIQAMMIGAFLVCLTYRYNKLIIGLMIGTFFYCILLLCNSYYFLIEGTPIQLIIDTYLHIFISARNGIFYGYFFMLLGSVIYRLYIEHVELFQCKKFRRILWLDCLLCYMLYIFELVCLQNKKMADDGAIYITQIFLVVSIIFICSCFKTTSNITINIRNLSTGMYLLHRPIISCFQIWKISSEILYILVCVVTISICITSYKMHLKIEKFLK